MPLPAPTPPPLPTELQALLAASQPAVHLLLPVHYAGGRGIADFRLGYLNEAARQLPGLPAQPGGTVLGSQPRPAADGLLYYYLRLFEAGGSTTYDAVLNANGTAHRYHFVARRQGEWLVVHISGGPPAAG